MSRLFVHPSSARTLLLILIIPLTQQQTAFTSPTLDHNLASANVAVSNVTEQ